MDNQFEEISAMLAARLIVSGDCLVTAESCTGGWVAKVLTDRAGKQQLVLNADLSHTAIRPNRRCWVSDPLMLEHAWGGQ